MNFIVKHFIKIESNKNNLLKVDDEITAGTFQSSIRFSKGLFKSLHNEIFCALKFQTRFAFGARDLKNSKFSFHKI